MWRTFGPALDPAREAYACRLLVLNSQCCDVNKSALKNAMDLRFEDRLPECTSRAQSLAHV